MTKFYTARYDRVFKTIMTNNKKILKALLESILNIKIEEITIMNNEREIKNVNLKLKIVDLLVKTKKEIIHIELNTNYGKYYHSRNVSYVFDSYVNNVRKGDNYNEDINFIGIDLTYNLSDSEIKREYKLIDESGLEYVQNFKMVEYNMDKCMDVWYSKNDERLKYLAMLDMDKDSLSSLSRSDEVVKEFNDEVSKLNENEEFVRTITPEEDFRLIMNSERRYAREEGHAEGHVEGHNDATVEIARNMLKENIDINIISKVTNLSIEEITNLK